MNQRTEKAVQILADRGSWEQQQRLFYQMRHDGLRRSKKPFTGAADLHFPLIDMALAKIKPFWVSQAFGGQRLCDFVAMRKQLEGMTESAADFFDFELRYRSNYRFQLERVVDIMLLRGRSVMKVVVDPYDGYAIKFKAIDPLFILVPQGVDELDDADYFVEVQHLSVGQYKRNRNYNQDQDVIQSIRGDREADFNGLMNDKAIREGITHSRKSDEIILWLHHERTPRGWTVYTESPQDTDKEIRKPFGIPYKYQNKVSLPYFSFTMEIKDEGWYSPRGIAQLNAAFEASATKMWNEKHDAMTFWNRPLFTSDKEITNPTNIRFNPGELIPGNIQAVQMPQPAMSFDEEINFTRELSEQRSRTPDFGITQNDGDARTATENNRIAALQDVGADHDGDIFRNVRLLKMYQHVWGLMLQFKRPNLAYFASNDLQELPEQALHDQYLVLPAVTIWNKNQKQQQSQFLHTTFAGAPNIDQDALAEQVISSVDSRLVHKLLIPSNQKQAIESYQAAVDIGVMMLGYPAPVTPGNDHAARLLTAVGFLQKQMMTGAPADPMAVQRIQQYIAQHLQFLQQLQPQAAKAVKEQIMMMEQGGMQNVAQMEGAM